jgi:hypothetical protein
MNTITIDSIISSKLSAAAGVVELRDPAGKILGRFIPHWDMADWESIRPELSEEELRRRTLETESYSTAEMLAYLENVKCTGSNGASPL